MPNPKPNTSGLKPWKAGQSGNPLGRPKSEPHMLKRCRAIVDAKVIDAWEQELTERGPAWVKCSELLVAYGYGRPKLDPESPDVVEGGSALRQLSREELQALARQSLTDDAAPAIEADDDDGNSAH